MKKRKGKDQKN